MPTNKHIRFKDRFSRAFVGRVSIRRYFLTKWLASGGFVCKLLRRCYYNFFQTLFILRMEGVESGYSDIFSAPKLRLLAELENANTRVRISAQDTSSMKTDALVYSRKVFACSTSRMKIRRLKCLLMTLP